MDEMNFLGQEWLDLREVLIRQVFGTANGRIDATHDILQEGHLALLTGDDSFPVPLVNIQRMEVVQLLIGSDGIHVGINAKAWFNMVFGQRESLPFSQRMNNFCLGVTQVLDGERHRALHAIEVIVDAQALHHKQRCRHTRQTQFGCQILLKEILDQLNALLRLMLVKQGLVMLRSNDFAHIICLWIFHYATVLSASQLTDCNAKL